MSAGRKHRKAAGRYRTAEALRAAHQAIGVVVGTMGDDDIVMRGTVMHVVPRPLPGMAPELAEAISRRRRATLDGHHRSDCGGRCHGGAQQGGHVGLTNFLHEEDCSAHDRAIAALVERTGWRWSA